MKELLKRATTDGVLSQRDLHLILDALPIPLSWASFPSGEILFTNLMFKKMFGYAENKIVNVNEWINLAYVNQSDQEKTWGMWNNLWAEKKEGVTEVSAIELKLRCSNGDILTVLHRGILLHDIGIGVATFEDISERKNLEHALYTKSLEDPLTRSGNRRALEIEWNKIISTSENTGFNYISVLSIDLDNFKPVNDVMGHAAGDLLLISVSDRMRECIPSDNLLFRTGGDEFVIIFPTIDAFQSTEDLCLKLKNLIEKPTLINGEAVCVTPTIGISRYPSDGEVLQLLLNRSDKALYRCKKNSKGQFVWFNQDANN